MKKYACRMAELTGQTQWMEISEILEATMQEQKGLKPNLDFPSGPAYHLMGFATDLFTPFFVMARITGWTAHIMEQLANNRLIRPLSQYIGPGERHVVPMAQRG
jgi:2-methylcitrate synthase